MTKFQLLGGSLTGWQQCWPVAVAESRRNGYDSLPTTAVEGRMLP